MKLYTINATPVRANASAEMNLKRIAEYPSVVALILSGYGIKGFTIYRVDGYWEDVPEVSFKIEIATDLSYFMVGEICNDLRDRYKQDAVMLTKPDNSVEFI